MSDDCERAKQLYFDFAGSQFQMWHDGVLDEYRGYKVSREQEAAWRREFVPLWLNRLPEEPIRALVMLRTMGATEALPELIRFTEQASGSVQMSCANALWDMVAPGPSLPVAMFPPAAWVRDGVRSLWRLVTGRPSGRVYGPARAGVPPEWVAQARETAIRVWRAFAADPDSELCAEAQARLK